MSTLYLHSVSYAGLWGQQALPLPQFLEKAAELGFDGVMLMAKRPHLSPLDYGPAERAALRQLLEKLKLSVILAGYNNITADLEHGEMPHAEIQVSYILELARLARDLGAPLLRVFTGYENAAAPWGTQWNLIGWTLREAARRAAPYGVTLGVQNHHDIASGWETLRDLVTAINEPNLRAMFDAWAPALQGADVAAAAGALAPQMAHTTVADYQLRPRYKYNAAQVNYEAQTPMVQAVPMGDGFIDYRGFFAALKAGGYSGGVAYEMCSPILGGGSIENLDRYARRFVEYMRG
jgi:sugar phosphate isomerase/epimerase